MNLDTQAITNFIKQEIPSLQALYVFGSVATSDDTLKSDLDLAFLSSSKLSSLTRFDIAQKLAKELNKDIDLIDLNEASEVMRFEVISKGQQIFSDNSKEVEAFEDKSYMLYIDLNENRMAILNDIKKRGTVYWLMKS